MLNVKRLCGSEYRPEKLKKILNLRGGKARAPVIRCCIARDANVLLFKLICTWLDVKCCTVVALILLLPPPKGSD